MATLYCGPSNTGAGTGSNFSNLLALPDTTGFTRGNTYIIVEGSYGSKTLSTATSGSTTITIKKASATDSGVTGYAASLHDGAATFGSITIATQRWILNGMTRTETNAWAAPAGYGFRASSITADSSQGHSANYSELSYMDVGETWDLNPSSGTIDTYGWGMKFVYNQSNILFSRIALHNTLAFAIHGGNDCTFEYCNFGPNWSKGMLCSPNVMTMRHIIRYNRFMDASMLNPNDPTSGTTAEIIFMQGGSAYDGHLIYGNWFKNSRSSGRNAVIQIGDAPTPSPATNCKVFNNTFANMNEGSVLSMIYLYAGSGNEVRNNLFYGCIDTDVTANAASHNVVASVNPFVDYANLDLRITSGSQARNVGTNVGSPYNVDPLGVTRGADGTWDVGAYEYDAGGSAPPTGTPVLSVR